MDPKAKKDLLLVIGGASKMNPSSKEGSSSDDTEPKKDEDEESYDPEHLQMMASGMKELGMSLAAKDYEEAAKVFMRMMTLCDTD
jgi:hypothetical protein